MSRKCPRTGVPLSPLKVGGVTVDISDSCGGVFFDQFEIERFDEQLEFPGEVLADEMANRQGVGIDLDQRIECPNCAGIVMMRRFYSPLRKVELDECPGCGGIWLDAGELATLREHFPDQKERERVRKQYVKEIMASPEVLGYEKGFDELESKLEHARTVLWRIIVGRRRI